MNEDALVLEAARNLPAPAKIVETYVTEGFDRIAFSPNDDAVHEFWEIENIHLYPNELVLVYDRNVRKVYRRRNYENAEWEAFGWKDQQGRILPSGNYYYVIDLENGDDPITGTVTIIR